MGYENIRGWFDFEDIYRDAVQCASNYDILVEIGVAYGKSLAFLVAEMLRQRRHLTVIGVDPWLVMSDEEKLFCAQYDGSPYKACLAQLAEHAPDTLAYAKLVSATSEEAARAAAHRGAKVGFVFIDGDHSYDAVKKDLAAWLPLLQRGGTIAGHDHTNAYPGVERAVREVFGSDYIVRGSSWVARPHGI